MANLEQTSNLSGRPTDDAAATSDSRRQGGFGSDAPKPSGAAVREVKRRDGTLISFDETKLGADVKRLLVGTGHDDARLAQAVTRQVIGRLARNFVGRVPTTDDVVHVVAMTLIDNNVGFAVKRYFEALMPKVARPDKAVGRGLKVKRVFSKEGTRPYDAIEWEERDAVIRDGQGKAVFEQKGVEVPKSWSQSATNIVASKYFRGEIGKSERERSVRQIIDRVAKTIAGWGTERGYFASEADARAFEDELTVMLVTQRAAFNSPVWFNVGVSPRPQCSACFINSVSDDMRSILNLTVTEGMLFKYGSGTGTNLSVLRSSREKLAHSSGFSSGPVSFMRGYDAFAGVIKSGGKTRRAAKMVILNVSHPDVVDFIECKVREERKAKALIAAGYDGSLEGEAYRSIAFQNANNSVRVDDDFMQAVENDGEWVTKAVTTGEPVEALRAKDVLRKLAAAAWECGDPGVQYDTIVNRWNPVKVSGRINGSNPCSEYMFLDDSACNLASINLMKFRGEDGEFDVETFRHAVDVAVAAQEILVSASSYPTPAIEENSHAFRPLGLGYANLGALLMSRGLAYDSEEGRNFAAAVTSLMTGRAYRQSAVLAEAMGPFERWAENTEPFMQVIGMHREAAYGVSPAGVPQALFLAAREAWDEAQALGPRHGFRNAQVSVLAPTGTIGFLMDCDTTGIEPDIALVKYKWLVGGGLMKIVNQTVPEALHRLGYGPDERQAISAWIDSHDTIEGAPGLKPGHLPVFDCAFRPAKGTRSIHYLGHLKMMAAVQPFLSGAISKTVNLPHEATVEDVEDVYVEGWKLGLKAVAIYRDGSKGQQVLMTSIDKKDGEKGKSDARPSESAAPTNVVAPQKAASSEPRPSAVNPAIGRSASGGEEARVEYRPRRRRLPDERRSLTHKFSIAGHEGYITVGLYDDGTPGEIFVRMAKGGTVVAGLIDSFATVASIAMQYGVPLKVLCSKFVHLRFEPSGFTANPNIRIAKSIMDYLFRWLALKFLNVDDQRALGVNFDVQTLAEAGAADVQASPPGAPETMQLVDNAACECPAPAAGWGSSQQLNIDHAAATLPLPEVSMPEIDGAGQLTSTFEMQTDAPICDTCGSIMVRNGACYKCLNCGSTSGCS
jgi:ribonucleoside-diphosphate reductase alpha chain